MEGLERRCTSYAPRTGAKEAKAEEKEPLTTGDIITGLGRILHRFGDGQVCTDPSLCPRVLLIISRCGKCGNSSRCTSGIAAAFTTFLSL